MGSPFPTIHAKWSLVSQSFWIMLSRRIRTVLNPLNNNNNECLTSAISSDRQSVSVKHAVARVGLEPAPNYAAVLLFMLLDSRSLLEKE